MLGIFHISMLYLNVYLNILKYKEITPYTTSQVRKYQIQYLQHVQNKTYGNCRRAIRSNI